jgi:hypothetical protein
MDLLSSVKVKYFLWMHTLRHSASSKGIIPSKGNVEGLVGTRLQNGNDLISL